MAQDPPTEPQVPAADAPATPSNHPSDALPDYLGRGESGPPPPVAGGAGAPNGMRVLLMAIAILVAGFLIYREFGFDRDGAGPSGRTTEYEWEVVTPDGTPVDLSDYKGRPILLNVWATWCPPCLMEMPALAALSRRPELKEANVAVVLVSIDGALEPVQQFLERVDMGAADILLAAGPPPVEFQSAGIPTTYFVSPDGRITRRESGAREWNTPEFASELVQLANEG